MKRHPSTNRLYRIIWSEALQAWVVASELSQDHCKTGGNHLLGRDNMQTGSDARLRHSIAHIFGVSLLGVSVAYATPGINELPSGGQISQGSGSISQNGNTLTVQQNSDKMIGQWNTFNIGEQATVNVQQPNAHSIALNRIHDSKPSEIYGKLNANGQIYLLNSNGVIFGKTAQVDVGGIVATTHRLGDKDFLNGKLVLTQQNALGKIDNQGRITAHGGLIAFIAPQVSNSGSLQNTGGTVAMAAGEQVTLDFQGDGLIKVKVDKAALNALAENKGLIQADGGTVIMTAQSANALMDTVVNNDGIIQAHTLANHKGRIVLDGGDEGVTRIAGTLDAGAPSLVPVNAVKQAAVGGTIIATGNKIRIDEGAHLSASGKTGGGKVLVGGSWQNSNHSLRQASATVVAKTAKLEANATGRGNGGTVVVGSNQSKADSVTRAYGTFEAQAGPNGGNGGRIQTSGHWLDVAGAQIDASAPNGKAGRWLFAAGTVAITDANADGASGSALGNDIWTSKNSPSTLLNTDIGSRLETGTDVTVSARGGRTEIGDITVSSAITKTSGDTDTTLTLQAANSIVIDQAIGNTGGSGKLHVALAAGNGGGSVLLNNNISTNGGDITFGTAASTGGDVYVGGDSAVSLTTSGGSVTVNGEMIIANTRGLNINSSNGNVSFGGSVNSGNRYTGVSSTLDWSSALANATSGSGKSVGDSYLATLTSRPENAVAAHSVNYRAAWLGARRIAKIGSDNAWRWVSGPEGLQSGDGLIFFYQDSGNTVPGLYSNWSHGQPNNYGGAADLSDEAQSALQFTSGVGRWNDHSTGDTLNYYVRETNLAASPLTVNAGSGTVTFSGAVGGNKALAALNVTATGPIAVNGGSVTTEGLQTYDGNLTLGSARTVLTQTNANTDFKLRSGNAIYSAGLSNSLTINTTDDIILGNNSSIGSFIGALNVTLNSDSDATGGGAVLMRRGSAISGKGGDIALNADRLTLAGTSRLQSSGKLTVQPRSAVTIGISDGAGALSLPASYFSTNFADGFSGITVGNRNSGAITVGDAVSFNDNTALIGGNTIAINGAINAVGQTLTLTGGSGKTVSGSGDIIADRLLLNGAFANYLLNTALHNNVGIVAATGVAKLAYRDSDALEIGTVNGISGISAGGFVDIATQNGDLTLAQKISAFALTLNAGEATAAGTSTGGNIVVNGLPRITALFGAKLFTGSVSGSTGLSALIGSGRGGFRYNSDESASNYSAALGLGKYAIYREQPMLSVTPGSATGIYGETVSTAAVSAKITNFVNGDNASQAGISGTAKFITTADNRSRVGVYDIAYNGGLSNALGYGITDATDSLGEYSITPRILNVTATGQNKVYDGTATATVTLHDNRIADDNLVLSNTGANFIDGNAATGKLIKVSGITVTGADAANYIFNTSTTAIADIEPNPAPTSIITSVLGSAQQTTIKVTTDAGLTVGSATLAIMSNGALIVDNSVDSPTAPLAQAPSPGSFTAPNVPVSAPVRIDSPVASAATAQPQERPRTRRRADSNSQKNLTLEQPASPTQSAPESTSQKTVEAAKTTLSDGLSSIKSGVNGVDTLQTALFEAAVGQGLPRQQAEQASNSFVRVLVQNLAKGMPLSVATKLAQGAFNSVTGTPRPSSPQAVAAGSLAGSGPGLGSSLAALSGATTPSGSAAFDASLSAGLAKGKSLDQAVQSARIAVQQIDAAITMDHSPMGSLSNGGAEGLADTPLSVQNSLSNALAKGISMEQALQRAYAAGIAADEAAKADARRPGSGLSSGNSASIKALPATGDFDKTLGVAMSRGISIEQAITHAMQINALQQQGVNADAKNPLAGFANGRQLSDRDNKHFDKALRSALARGLAPAAAIDRARQAVQNLQTEAQSLSASLASGKSIDALLSSLGHSRIFDKILGKALARGVPPDEAVNLAQRAEAAGALHFQLPSQLTSAIPANSQVEITTGSGAPLPSWLRYMPETHQLMAYDIPPGALPMQVIMTVNGKPATVEITETGIRL